MILKHLMKLVVLLQILFQGSLSYHANAAFDDTPAAAADLKTDSTRTQKFLTVLYLRTEEFPLGSNIIKHFKDIKEMLPTVYQQTSILSHQKLFPVRHLSPLDSQILLGQTVNIIDLEASTSKLRLEKALKLINENLQVIQELNDRQQTILLIAPSNHHLAFTSQIQALKRAGFKVFLKESPKLDFHPYEREDGTDYFRPSTSEHFGGMLSAPSFPWNLKFKKEAQKKPHKLPNKNTEKIKQPAKRQHHRGPYPRAIGSEFQRQTYPFRGSTSDGGIQILYRRDFLTISSYNTPTTDQSNFANLPNYPYQKPHFQRKEATQQTKHKQNRTPNGDTQAQRLAIKRSHDKQVRNPSSTALQQQDSPYQIVHGTLTKVNGKLVFKTAYRDQKNYLDPEEKIFLIWKKSLVANKAYPASWRETFDARLDSYKITDVRLYGRIDRIMMNKASPFGFISHPLYPNNLYFRIIDIDGIKTEKPSLNELRNLGIMAGSFIGFRVAQRADRKWALRVFSPDKQTKQWIKNLRIL